MLKITIERVFGTLIPGALFLIGVWYIHRPFLLKYFPNLAGDPTQSEIINTEFKAVIFVVVAFSTGMLLNQLSDIGVVLLFREDPMSTRPSSKARRVGRFLWRFIVFNRYALDPRQRSVSRYLRSPRRQRFLKMMKDWAATDEQNLNTLGGEVIIAHEHIIYRLRVLSEMSRRMIENMWLPVIFSASMLAAFVLLLPVIALSPGTSYLIGESLDTRFWLIRGALVLFVYAGAALSSYSLKRQFRHYCHYVLTLGLHLHSSTSRVVRNSPAR